jgi:thiol-disulfide isomerase/thioredoxin
MSILKDIVNMVKKYCDDDVCLMIVFVLVGFGLCFLFKDRISGFANLRGEGGNNEGGHGHAQIEPTAPIVQRGQGQGQGQGDQGDQGDQGVGVQLNPRKPEPTPSTKRALEVMNQKPPVERNTIQQEVGLLVQDATIFKPFDEVWNPGFMPLDMVFKNINEKGPSIIGPSPMGPSPMGPSPMGPDRPMGPSPMGPSPMGPSPMGPSPMGPSPMGPSPMGPDRPMGPSLTGGGGGTGGGTGGDLELVLIYAAWCGHSKRMLPDYERIKSEFDGKNINGKNIHVSMYTDEDEDKVKEYGVKGFPSLFIEKDGNRESFPHRTYEKMSEYLNNI